jgi:hypothetical protein
MWLHAWKAALVLAFALEGCGAFGGDSRCPARVPRSGEPCVLGQVACGYLSCGTFGVARAQCVLETWSVSTTPCAPISCGGTVCAVGDLCRTDVGGARVSRCVANPCGAGAVSCQCVCGGACATNGERNDPPIALSCNTCPGGGCP